MELKYVIIKQNGYLQPMVFSTTLDHSTFRDFHVVSAGFVDFTVSRTVENSLIIECSTYGRSVTLNVNSRPEDNQLLTQLFQNQY